MPKITVLMPVYNGGRFLREAIESILGQTLRDFEFLIIDDGSTDGSVDVVESYKDERIRLVRNGRNLGLIETLNKGLQMARGQYVARMDADDVSLPQRLELQFDYMERHRDICVVSSYFQFIDENRRVMSTYKSETKDFLISFKMYVEGYNPICHPAAMFRTRPVREAGGYSKEFPHAEDGALWFRLDSLAMKFSVVPRILLLYRYHSQQITQTKVAEGHCSHFTAHAQRLSELLRESVTTEEAAKLSPYGFDANRFRTSEDIETVLLLKRRIALAFFLARGFRHLRVTLCVADLWNTLFFVRKLDAAPADYTRRLWRYSLEILRQGLNRDGKIVPFLCKGLFMACMMRFLLIKLWDNIRGKSPWAGAPGA